MFSTELRSTFSQELGAALRQSLTDKLTELAGDIALPTVLRDEAQRTLDMLTASYDCSIYNPATGTREMIIPAVILLADDKGHADKPLLMLMVDFSNSPDDQDAARLLHMYPGATILRADIPYQDPSARSAAFNSGSTTTSVLHTCSYDIIIHSSNAAATSHFHQANKSSCCSPPAKLHYLVRNRALLQHQETQPANGEPLEIPLAILLPELAWRVALAHPAAGAAGLLSIQLQHETLRRCLSIAAVRQKNVDMLRSRPSTEKKPGPSPFTLPLGGWNLMSTRGLHTRASPWVSDAASACSHASRTAAGCCGDDPAVDVFRGHGHGLGFSSVGLGGRASRIAIARGCLGFPGSHLASLRTILGFGRRFSRRMRC